MAYHYADNVCTKAFTPREYQVELLAAAKERNIIVCLGNGSNKVFISLKLIQELANETRRPYRRGGKRTVLISSSTTAVVQHALSIRHLTDLKVGEYVEAGATLDLHHYQVLVMMPEVCLAALTEGRLKVSDMNLLILDDCHLIIRDHPMRQVIEVVSQHGRSAWPRVLGLTAPLLPGPGGVEPGRLQAEIQRLESVLHATVESASDIVSILRYAAKPKEVVLECANYSGSDLGVILKEQLDHTRVFLEDHRYDPSEIYDEEFLEDLKNIPNPKDDPESLLGDFQHVLSTMGPWCADRAALVLLIHIEKLKVKTPYERHFLLLCMVSSVMLKIRAIFEYELQDVDDKDKIYQFSSPKVLRLIEAISNFKPKTQPEQKAETKEPETIQSLETSTEHEPKCSRLSNKQTVNCDTILKLDLSGVTKTEETEESNLKAENGCNSSRTISETNNILKSEQLGNKNQNNPFIENQPITRLEKISVDDQIEPIQNENHTINGHLEGLSKRDSLAETKQTINSSDLLFENHLAIIKKDVLFMKNQSESIQNCELFIENQLVISDKCDTVIEDQVHSLTNGLLNSLSSNSPKDNNCTKEILSSNHSNSEEVVIDQASSEKCYQTSSKKCCQASSEKCVQATSEKYDHAGSEKRDQASSKKCDQASSEKCDQASSEKFDQASSEKYDQASSEKCDETGSKKCQASSEKCDQASSEKCDQASSEKFDHTGSEKCDQASSEKYDHSSSEKFDHSGSVKCDQASSEKCDHASSEKCDQASSEKYDPTGSKKCDHAGSEKCNQANSDPTSSEKAGETEVVGRGGRWRSKGRGWRFQKKGFASIRSHRPGSQEDADQLCGIIFVENPFTAKILFHLFNELRRCDPNLAFISPQYTVSKVADPITEPREAEVEHRKQEEVLKRFRMRECNLLISTSILEEGIDLPKCNLVVRYDVPSHYRSYAQSKGRARAQDSHFLTLVEQHNTQRLLADMAQFIEIDKMLLSRCSNREPSEEEEAEADKYVSCVPAYSPGTLSANLSLAISLVNRYCAKLPSDTFTRLTPLWSIHTVNYQDQHMFYCKVRLPINSPVKQDILGHPMPLLVLAKRIAALETVRVLHTAKELDDNLQPIGKESFHNLETELVEEEEEGEGEADEPRPGTTKRRQYYYKRIASSLSDCRPRLGEPALLYHLEMVLTCPLPEEQNTRGRKLYPPEDAPQGFGILTLKPIPKICPFPIFTRSGEVCVSLSLQQQELVLTEDQLEMIAVFLNYTFTSVLRLQKYLMLFDPDASENCYFIVPTKKDDSKVVVDWDFLKVIYSRREEMPHLIPDEERTNFAFDPVKYHDAVVMPWYRNQDQPQYFYVAEICNHLNPKSSFPGSDYQTFEEYYQKKYGISVQNKQQPLLDVDHTSARLNFLTPRYVNRKGVALPTSSEETKRAKRENLEQKQILVPELCMIHPFPASLWRQAVCLPCVLYRINALLLADEIRTTVAREIALGQLLLSAEFEWRPLDFGWSLADVLKKSKEESERSLVPKIKSGAKIIELIEPTEDLVIEKGEEFVNVESNDENDSEKQDSEDKDDFVMEIGTWSNEMAEGDFDSSLTPSTDFSKVRYGSPTSWDYNSGGPGVVGGGELCLYDSDMESDVSDSVVSSDSDSSMSQQRGGLKITFRGDFLAEAEDDEVLSEEEERSNEQLEWQCHESNTSDELQKEVDREVAKFEVATQENLAMIMNNGMLVRCGKPFTLDTDTVKTQASLDTQSELGFQLNGYAMPVKDVKELISSDKTLSPSKSPWDSAFDSESDLSTEDSSDDESDVERKKDFSFDSQPDLAEHPGPSPSLLLQALTMSNANDGINLERLETIGDSFLKYAITTYLYCAYDTVHEGKLSHLRSKQVSNLNLYRLGKRKLFGESMIATKFEPHDNWLPPCYLVPREVERALVEAGLPACLWNQAELPTLRGMSRDEIIAAVKEKVSDELDLPCFVPYNLITQHSIPDKSIADCVEALIGAYLIACGPRGALLFMSWLGIRVLPSEQVPGPATGHAKVKYGELRLPKSPLLRHVPDPESELSRLLDGFKSFEHKLKYQFRDRSYLLQSMTHASYSPNRLTDCYQRLEFLGDAVLDYLITRHLYEDKRQHCPGALTDLRSALVNNTIFASLAVRHGFHKYFRHLSPGLAEVVDRFVRIQEENCHAISEEYYLIGEEECEEAEDVEVPKALGDVFESVAGAIFLDSGMSLDAVWRVYYRMMKNEIEQFSTNVPKSPIRELLELEPETAKFGKPEKLADGRRVRVTVEVFGKGVFKGIGRNYRIAKCTAAKCALRQLKKRGLLARKLNTAQLW